MRELRPSQWYSLLVQGRDPATGQGTARDCTGAPVEWHEPPRERCTEPAPESEPLEPRAFTDDDVVVGRAPGNFRLVWVITQRFSDGEGVGPIALVEFVQRGVAVRAIGTLRARTGRARLRIETVGGERIVVAEGEHCSNPEDPATCRRAARLLAVRGNRLSGEHLMLDGTDACVGPAYFHLARDQWVDLPSGWRRHFELNTTLTFNTGVVGVHESMVVRDQDPRVPAVPPRLFRRVDADRRVLVSHAGLYTDQPSLWVRVMERAASVQGGDAGAQRSSNAGTDDAGAASSQNNSVDAGAR